MNSFNHLLLFQVSSRNIIIPYPVPVPVTDVMLGWCKYLQRESGVINIFSESVENEKNKDNVIEEMDLILDFKYLS